MKVVLSYFYLAESNLGNQGKTVTSFSISKGKESQLVMRLCIFQKSIHDKNNVSKLNLTKRGQVS